MENEITKNLFFLTNNLTNLDSILLLLEEKEIISTNEREEILSNQISFQRNRKFWDMIRRKDYNKNRNLILEILRQTKNGHCADIIENGSNAQLSSALVIQDSTNPIIRDNHVHPQIWFEITASNRFYVGREKEMKFLEKYWNTSKVQKTLSIIAVTGLGGVGKSELAKNFANWFYENVKGHCIWIGAETNQLTEESFKNLAKSNFKISLNDHSGKERTFQEIAQEVFEKLFGKEVLFVFDNVENYESPILQLLTDLSAKKPPTVMKPFVITTSRLSEASKYFGSLCNQIDLQVLTKDSSIRFFYKSLNHNEPSEENKNQLIEKLCERLQFYPLAMQQASAYIKEKLNFSGHLSEVIENYLDQMETISKKLLNHKLSKYESSFSNTTFLTWKITFDKLREESGGVAVDIMNVISFLSPDSIPTQMITKILQNTRRVSENANIDIFFELIRKYSMINFSGGNLISVHRLVQEVTRIELGEKGELSALLSEIAKVMIDMLKGEEISLKELIHVQAVWQNLTKEKELIEKHGEILWEICEKLQYSGKYRDMLDFSIESGELLEFALGQNNRWTLQMKHMNGVALKDLGEYSEAFQVLEETYEKQKHSLGEEHRDCLDTAKEIGFVYYRLENYEEAMKIYNDALGKAKRIYGKEYKHTLDLKHNIAMVLYAQNKLKEAIEVYAEVLEVKERLLGKEHPDTLATKHNIATVKLEQQDYEEALTEFQEVLQIQERVLELDHPHTLSTKYFIAVTYYNLGRHEESLQMLQEVHECQVQILGPRHPQTIETEQWIEDVEMEIALQRSLTAL